MLLTLSLIFAEFFQQTWFTFSEVRQRYLYCYSCSQLLNHRAPVTHLFQLFEGISSRSCPRDSSRLFFFTKSPPRSSPAVTAKIPTLIPSEVASETLSGIVPEILLGIHLEIHSEIPSSTRSTFRDSSRNSTRNNFKNTLQNKGLAGLELCSLNCHFEITERKQKKKKAKPEKTP